MNAMTKLATAAAAAVLLTSTAGATGPDGLGHRHGRSIVGVWLMEVTLTNCATGASIGVPPFKAINTFHEGGTLSEHGAYIHRNGEAHHIPAHRRKIVDVSGAGDTVIAVAALALAQDLSPERIAQLANLAGGLVCEEVGVVPIDPARFRSEWEQLQPTA